MAGGGPCAVYEPAAGHYYSWAGAMSQLNGHLQVLGTFPSSLELWLSPLTCCLLGTCSGLLLGGHKRDLQRMQAGVSTLHMTPFSLWLSRDLRTCACVAKGSATSKRRLAGRSCRPATRWRQLMAVFGVGCGREEPTHCLPTVPLASLANGSRLFLLLVFHSLL